MKDPTKIARGIADKVASLLNVYGFSRQDAENMDAIIQEIAGALREYGKAEVTKALLKAQNEIGKMCHEADTAGYRRGVEDQEKVKHMTRTQRVVLDVDINASSTSIDQIHLKSCDNIKNEIQRGQEGGNPSPSQDTNIKLARKDQPTQAG